MTKLRTYRVRSPVTGNDFTVGRGETLVLSPDTRYDLLFDKVRKIGITQEEFNAIKGNITDTKNFVIIPYKGKKYKVRKMALGFRRVQAPTENYQDKVTNLNNPFSACFLSQVKRGGGRLP